MKHSRFLLLVILALGALAIFGSLVALAEGETKQVGLVVSFPDGSRYTDLITVPVTSTTLQVLRASTIDLVDTNGQFGPTVCSIKKTGCPASNCFCDPKHFWAFYELDKATNKWVASQVGVGAAVPANGAVEGFAWSEMDANYNPLTQPPVMTLADIQAARSKTPSTVPSQPAATATGQGPAKLPATGGSPAGWALVAAAGLVLGGLWLIRGARFSGGKV
jgi:LPXTG-motif cell wall-anchored protein